MKIYYNTNAILVGKTIIHRGMHLEGIDRDGFEIDGYIKDIRTHNSSKPNPYDTIVIDNSTLYHGSVITVDVQNVLTLLGLTVGELDQTYTPCKMSYIISNSGQFYTEGDVVAFWVKGNYKQTYTGRITKFGCNRNGNYRDSYAMIDISTPGHKEIMKINSIKYEILGKYVYSTTVNQEHGKEKKDGIFRRIICKIKNLFK